MGLRQSVEAGSVLCSVLLLIEQSHRISIPMLSAALSPRFSRGCTLASLGQSCSAARGARLLWFDDLMRARCV